jgi:hypothetical protein
MASGIDEEISVNHNWNDDNYGKGKSKAIPLQVLTRPEASRRLRLPDFKKICT